MWTYSYSGYFLIRKVRDYTPKLKNSWENSKKDFFYLWKFHFPMIYRQFSIVTPLSLGKRDQKVIEAEKPCVIPSETGIREISVFLFLGRVKR